MENSLFREFLDIKKRHNILFYDTHVHPLEVFGLLDNKITLTRNKEGDIPVPSLLEKLGYGSVALSILHFLFLHFPGYITSEIKKNFYSEGETMLNNILLQSGIDKAVYVPIVPAASPDILYSRFDATKTPSLGSIDPNHISYEDIESEIKHQKNNYHIVGIKLHPNIHSFYPYPSLNSEDLGAKVHLIYKTAEKLGLYILIHGGLSFVPINNGKEYEKREFGLLENFMVDKNISIFSDYNIIFQVAHLGSYNVSTPNFDLMHDIINLNQNIFFDTAGINPKHVTRFIRENGCGRIVFGSDTLYFNMKYAVLELLHVLKNVSSDFEKDTVLVFNKNFEESILGMN